MRHGVKSYTFKGGSDANKMLIRKLVVNFLANGKLTTTETRAKYAKSILDHLVEKSKVRTEANKNYLLRKVAEPRVVEFLFTEIGPAIKDIKGGYIKITKIGYRDSDGSPSARLEWAHPVVKVEPVKEKKA